MFDDEQETERERAFRELREKRVWSRGSDRPPPGRLRIIFWFTILFALGVYLYN